MKVSVIALTGLCLFNLGTANKYLDRKKQQQKTEKHVLNTPSKKKLQSYDGAWCPYKETDARK